MPIVTTYKAFATAANRQRSPSPKREPRTPSPTNNFHRGPLLVPAHEFKEFKVGSWGSSDKRRRLIREKMVESGIYLVSDWGKNGVNRRRMNAVQSIRVGDIIHVPMYRQGYEYVGTVKGSMTMISYETIQQNYPEISQATWGNDGPAVDETFMQFAIQWNKVTLTDKSTNDLKRLVADGGRCLETNATFIRMK